MLYSIKKSEEERLRQRNALSVELGFEKHCIANGISHTWLEKDRGSRLRILKNPDGKCPDFLCVKGENHIFVEVKTHTLLTNEARNREMSKKVQAKKANGLSGTTIFKPFDPHPELKTVFGSYLKNTSSKFKNIKEEIIPAGISPRLAARVPCRKVWKPSVSNIE